MFAVSSLLQSNSRAADVFRQAKNIEIALKAETGIKSGIGFMGEALQEDELDPISGQRAGRFVIRRPQSLSAFGILRVSPCQIQRAMRAIGELQQLASFIPGKWRIRCVAGQRLQQRPYWGR